MDKYQPHSKLYRATTVEPLADQDFGFPNTMPTTPAEMEYERREQKSAMSLGVAVVAMWIMVAVALIALGVHFYFRGQA